jgi:hypothetical protein
METVTLMWNESSKIQHKPTAHICIAQKLCECGENVRCVVCGNGQALIPCKCRPLQQIKLILQSEPDGLHTVNGYIRKKQQKH